MKLFKPFQSGPRKKNVRAFTLVEMLTTVGIFMVVFTGVMIGIQIFGFRIYTLAATKLVSTAGGRETLNFIRDQIRGAKILYVGNCSAMSPSSFQLISTNSLQSGNALILYPTTNLNAYTIFYLDTNSSTNLLIQFNVTNTATATNITYTNILAKYITNMDIFDLENYMTTVATSEQALDNRLLVKVKMQFSEWEFPIAVIGSNSWNAYDYYQLRTRIFRRTWN